MEISSAGAALFGALIVAVANIIVTLITNNKSYKLQIDLENLKRVNNNKDFLRKNLLEIQSLIDNVIETFVIIQVLEVKENIEKEEKIIVKSFDEFDYSNKLKEFDRHHKLIKSLSCRLLNSELRRLIDDFINNLSDVLKKGDWLDKPHKEIPLKVIEITKKIGEEIRKTY